MLFELNTLARAQSTIAPGTGPSPFDLLRRKYLTQLADHTGRDTIVYATKWLEPNAAPLSPDSLSVVLGDVQAFMETCSNLTSRNLDLIITSPGGDPTAAESVMEYLRDRFDHIRAIIPVAAMSAATMMAMACDEIVMGSHSQLGPIDPQITVVTPEGPRQAPAQAILDQFELAKSECQNPANLGAWLPMLRGLLPGLLTFCTDQQALSRTYAERWLTRYMLAPQGAVAADLARQAAEFFTDYRNRGSHSRPIRRQEACDNHLVVIDLEDDQILQDAVLSVHHAVRHTLSGTAATKLVENQFGRAYIESAQTAMISMTPPTPVVPLPVAPPPDPRPGSPVRQIRPPGDSKRRGKKR